MFFTNNKLIAGETRDLINKQAYLFAVNYENCTVLLKNLQLEQKWWISISHVNDRLIFLSSYRKPDMPEHLGIITVGISSGDIRWQKDDLTFLFADDDYVYAYKQLFESKKYYKLKIESGETLNELTVDEIDSIPLLKQKIEMQQYMDFAYPLTYSPGEENESSKYFSSRFAGSELKGPVEYANYDNYLVYNYHEQGEILGNKLEVYDNNIKEVVFKEILNRHVSSYVPDSFFIKDSYLFYVREKTELTSIKLK